MAAPTSQHGRMRENKSLLEWLNADDRVISTGCTHPPLLLGFRVLGAAGPLTEFTVEFRDRQANLHLAILAGVDHQIECSEQELNALLTGHTELLGPFWGQHLPQHFSWAPLLYAYLFPEHAYLALNPVFQELYRTPRYYPMVTPFTQGYVLHRLVVDEHLSLTLEIGLAYGGSAMFFCEGHRQNGKGRHFALDPFQQSHFANEGLQFIEKAGLSNFLQFLPAKAEHCLPALLHTGLRFDLIYIDGDHKVSAVLSDFLQANALLRVGGLLAFDDSHWPSGKQTLAIIRQHFPYELVADKSTDRLTILRKVRHVDAPIALLVADRVRKLHWHTRQFAHKSLTALKHKKNML